MRLCVIGTGYVGLVSGACLADVGNSVCCVDRDEAKVAHLKQHRIPIYEPGLEDVVRRNIEENRIFFTTSLAEGLKGAEVCFITVDTPPGGDGRADLTNVLAVAKEIGELLDHPAIVVTKSTVPVGTTMKVKGVIAMGLAKRGLNSDALLSVASNPEFLKEGAAVEDFMKPDRVVIGVENPAVAEKLRRLYAPFMRRQERLVEMSVASSELTKYAANAMLATRISFMNEFARLCDKVGADISDIRRGLGSDPRIGPDFLYAGLGYGGSCFPKDTKAVIELGKEFGTPLSVVEAVDQTNDLQRDWFWEKITRRFGGEGSLKGKRVAVWGVAFKANTDDVRFAPSLYFIERLCAAGATVAAFDPAAAETARAALGARADGIRWPRGAYEALEGADALIICAEWREFRSPDFGRMRQLMRSPVVFDGRNLYDPRAMSEGGFTYVSVGRPCGA
ncbi:MAG TPA: UDP-glucose/GDP-mannose dehydrogenase family protein [bacterium]|nr:UDP-glucose/GDP-mannose dehydrogenase family protein [bacterium]